MTPFTPEALERLRADVALVLSPKRYAHTLGVEQTAAEMAALYAPEKEGMLRAAALLHDLTKEYGEKDTARVLESAGVIPRTDELASPQILHAMTAPAEISRRYPALATRELLSCVRWHTTGRAGMTLCEAILYLADVIEPGRTYPACVALRERFFTKEISSFTPQMRLVHLRDAVLCSLEGTCASLLAKNVPVCRDTLEAIEDLRLRNTF